MNRLIGDLEDLDAEFDSIDFKAPDQAMDQAEEIEDDLSRASDSQGNTSNELAPDRF